MGASIRGVKKIRTMPIFICCSKKRSVRMCRFLVKHMVMELPKVEQAKSCYKQEDACCLENKEYVQSGKHYIPEFRRVRENILENEKVAGKTNDGFCDNGKRPKDSISRFAFRLPKPEQEYPDNHSSQRNVETEI